MQLAAQQSRLVCSRQPVLPVRSGTVGRRRTVQARAVLDSVEHASTLAQALASGHSLHSLASHAATLAYEPIALPCSLQRCGDIVHRASLDPVLRKEVTGIPWQTYALLATVGLYLFATPGVVQGWWDYYIIAPWQRRTAPNVITKEDIKLGKKLGSGGFGSVYKGELMEDDGTTTAVVVKKAKEFGEAEVWMNERMMRFAPDACARFLTAFQDGNGLKKEDSCIWLVWKDEGEDTLYDLILKREWPYNLEPLLVGRELRLPRGKRRKLVTIRLAMRQLLQALRACHATGIVHRDIKPQNVIVSPAERRLKLIDMGAAADLRIGINYVPNEYLLDPRYAPPQQYVMSTQTPKPPPKPVAALLSPVLWRMENPDRFDMYSAGITLLQMALPNLRSGNNLIAFNRRLEAADYDLGRWRREELARKPSKELEEGFELLDCDGGAGWELACKLVAYSPGERLSAADALNHRWFDTRDETSTSTIGLNGTLSRTVGTVTTMAASVGSAVDSVLPQNMLQDAIAHGSGDGLSEAELARMFGYNRAAPQAPRNASQTIAWFQGRQSELQRKVEERSKRLATVTRRSIRGVQRRLLPWSILTSSKPNAGAPAAPSAADSAAQQRGPQQRPAPSGSSGRAKPAAGAAANGKPAAVAAFNGSAGKQGAVRVLAPASPAAAAANGDGDSNSNRSASGEAAGERKRERFAVFGGRR